MQLTNSGDLVDERQVSWLLGKIEGDMATVEAFYEINFTNIDLNFYYRNLYESNFYNNQNFSFGGQVFEDVIIVNGYDGWVDLGLGFGGYGIQLDAFGNVTAGVVTGIAESFWGGDAIWYATGLSVSAVQIYNAALTIRNLDDLAILQTALSGNDQIYLSAGNDRVSGYSGNDQIFGRLGNDTLLGGFGDDRLIGGAGADELDGGDGFDFADYTNQTLGLTVSLSVPASNTGIAAGDSFFGIEAIAAGSGNDALTGDDAANRLVGNLGNDTLSGAGGNDTLNGGEGNDWLEGGSGDDVLNGGAGFDRAVFSGATAVTVNLGVAGQQDTGHGLDSLIDVEAVTSGSGNDLLIGNALANTLNGGLGDDTIRGGAGNDTVNGADGDDMLTGGGGNDLLVGGAGIDMAVYAGAVGAVVNLATLTAQNTGLGIDTLSGIENLTGGSFADRLTGDAQANRLGGNAGNDTLQGGAGDDTLLGGEGDDRLGGGSGNDLLEGGLGADQFVFNTGGGNDFVSDFEDGLDHIRIGTGAESFSDLMLSEIGSDTVITFSDVSITLAGISQTQITSSDFLFV